MSAIKISENLQEIYKEEGISEPEFDEIVICEYCKEDTKPPYDYRINDKIFCCQGCMEKWEKVQQNLSIKR